MRFATLTALMFLAISAFGQGQKIFQFSDGKKYDWWIAPQHTKVEYNEGKTLKLTLSKYPGYGEQYPRIFIANEKMPIRDWSSAGTLSFHLETPTGGKFWIQIKDSARKAINLTFDLKPGKYEIERFLSKNSGINWKEIRSIEIAAERPQNDIILIFGDFRLNPFTQPPPKNDMVKLSDFEKNLGIWLVRTGTSFEKSAWPSANTSACTKLVFKKYTGKGEEWPAVILKTPYLFSDWSNAKSLEFEVESPTGGNIFLQFRAGREHKNYSMNLPRGRHWIKIPAKHFPVHRDKMTELHIVSTRPTHDIIVYMGEPILHLVDLKQLKKELSARLEKIGKEYPDLILKEELEKYAEKVESGKETALMTQSVEELESLAQRRKLQRERGNRRFIAAWCSSLEKIHREKQVFHTFPTREIVIESARGEGESAQLILLPAQNLKHVKTAIAELPRNKAGQTIPSTAITLIPVGYIYCKEPVYRVPGERTGWRPDPLLAYTKEMDLEKEKYQPYLLDMQIPGDQAPGIYNGKILVECEGERQLLPFSVKVHHFTLNRNLAYPTLVSYSLALKNSPLTRNNPERWKQDGYNVMLANNMTPSDIYNAGNPLSAEDAKRMISEGARCFNVMHVDYYHEKELPLIKKAMESYKAAGIADKALVYGFDERSEEYYGKLRDMASKIKQENPGLRFATTTWDESFGSRTVLKDAVDIWIPTTWRYETHPAEIAEARKRGKQVWWYVAMGPHLPYANCFIENTALQTRLLMGVMAWKYKTEGFLYWASYMWKDLIRQDNGKWKSTERKEYLKGAPLTNWPSYTIPEHNGDGNLVYPAPEGILASFRLKNMRDGMDDYIYFRMLEAAVKEAKTGKTAMPLLWQEKAEKELQIEKELLKSLTEYTSNPELLADKRSRIAALLDEYSKNSR